MKTKLIAALIAAVMLTGCASNVDYARYVDSQKEIAVARANAESERYRAMAIIAQSGDATTKVAAMFAMQNSTSGVASQGSVQQIMAPKSGWDSAKEWAGIILPSAVSIYGINANQRIATTQSNNSRDVAISTNDAFVGIAGQIQAPAANNTTTNTLSGTGVLGSGSYTTNANPVLSGTGVIGAGSYATTANPTTTTDNHTTNPTTVTPPGRICVVDAAGVLTCQ